MIWQRTLGPLLDLLLGLFLVTRLTGVRRGDHLLEQGKSFFYTYFFALLFLLLRRGVRTCVDIKFYGAFTCSMAWRCRFLTGAPDALVDFHTGSHLVIGRRPGPWRRF